ncbi:MAG: methanol--corrinoid methyltransferase [Candidatus Methanoplasma sp.]|jgi:methanol--5-hydroxybenzimidazolylcobamide Co-methyltransferase|nr:methanol--corrinoid methyltransferase [Candidatus Methanoplasma sp.]
MAATRFTKMAYSNPDEIVFGTSKSPVSYGFGIKVGAGRVIPELNYAPRPGSEKDPARLKKEYVDYISKDVLTRAVTLGFPDVQLETEWVSQMGNKKFSIGVVEGQKEITEKFHEEYGINCAVRQTLPDQREAEEGLRIGNKGKHLYPEALIGCAEVACENGADVLACETMGGKELADYAVTSQDITAFLYGVGYLGAIDMEYVWSQFVDIAKKNKVTVGGDTNCSGANVSMFMAGGMLDQDVQKTFSAVTRAISAARTMVAMECGASGPDKDCGYEGPIIKTITGRPAAQEGKNCQCAHADLQGNLMAQICDLWSNESVEYHPEFGGSSVQCWLGSLGYEVALMNCAIATGQEKTLRDLYMITDRTRGPEGYMLAYDNAFKVGEAIAGNGKDIYLRAKAAGITAAKVIKAGYDAKELPLTTKQKDVLDAVLKELEALPDNADKFFEYCDKKYAGVVPNYNKKNYGL